MPHDPRHKKCPDCGQDVWRFRSKRLEKEGKDPYYLCDTNQHRNYHVCEDEPEEKPWAEPSQKLTDTIPEEPKLQVKPKAPEPEEKPIRTGDEPEGFMYAHEMIGLPTAEDELKFQQGFRYLELTASKAKRVSEELIPELGQYGKYEYFQRARVTIDNPDMDVTELIRRLYLEIDTRISEQITLDRAKLIKALEEGIK